MDYDAFHLQMTRGGETFKIIRIRPFLCSLAH